MAKVTNARNTVYATGLQTYWGGRPQTAIEYVSKVLAEEPDHVDQFGLYRLWIEALADMNSKQALESLTAHLVQRAQGEDNVRRHANYMALRGLIHMELDQMQAARLLDRALASVKGNPYVLEFRQIYAQRLNLEGAPLLLSAQGALADYFHWQTLARGLFIRKESAALENLLDRVQRSFAGSPLRQVFDLHRAIESGDFEKAATHSHELAKRMPGHPDYDVIAAWAALHGGQVEVAEERLSHAIKVVGEQDVDAMALMGHVEAIRACHTGEKEDLARAEMYLTKAVSLLKSHGLPCARSIANLAIMQEGREAGNDGAAEAMYPGRAWLMKLSPRRYHEIRSSDEAGIDQIMRPMGAAPRSGDLVFFAGDLPNGYAPDHTEAKNWWNIAAIYAVSGEPAWDPIHRQQSVLQLVSRPSEPIPVEVFMMDEENKAELAEIEPDHPYRHGVFELEGGALDIIMEAIKRRRYGIEEAQVEETVRRIS